MQLTNRPMNTSRKYTFHHRTHKFACVHTQATLCDVRVQLAAKHNKDKQTADKQNERQCFVKDQPQHCATIVRAFSGALKLNPRNYNIETCSAIQHSIAVLTKGADPSSQIVCGATIACTRTATFVNGQQIKAEKAKQRQSLYSPQHSKHSFTTHT
mgnify:CR=1 FL=1